MQALRVLPPAHYIGAVESIPLVIEMIERLQRPGATYRVDDDLYFSAAADPAFGQRVGLRPRRRCSRSAGRARRRPRAARARRTRSTSWCGAARATTSRPGTARSDPGRPGWHIECAAIAQHHLGGAFDVQGGGSDLVFPHHEMSAGHAQVAHPDAPFAKAYVHAGMVGYDGEKMSKSKGNLVFVSALRNSDVDPMAIRLALLRHHYRSDWEWADAELLGSGRRP